MSNLKARVGIILALVLASVWALWPRTVIERKKDADGAFVYGPDSSFVYDTVKRINLKRGLDLQGGMHLTLEVDESKGAVANKSEALDNALTVVRNRIDEFGVAEPVVQKVGSDRIIVELPGIDDPERAARVVQRSAFLEFQIVDESQALERVLPRIDQIVKDKGGAALATTSGAAPSPATSTSASLGGLFGGDSARKDTLQAVATAAGDSARKDSTRADSALLGQSTTGAFSRLLVGGTGMPGQFLVAMKDVALVTRYLAIPEVQAALPPGKEILWGTDTISNGQQPFRALYVLDERPILTGEYLVSAKPQTDPMEGALVQFTLNNEGGRRFKQETGRHLKDLLATVLDERVVSRPAVIQSSIGTRGQITMGGRDIKNAQDFATVLNAGKLPVPLKVAEVRNIGPSLGQDSINKGIIAGGLAILLVVLIMVGYYRFSGLLAVCALVLYVLYTLAALAGFDAVLTLPGLAGFVLSIGIAVDANVLVFERIREELDRGHTVRTAIDEGFRHALPAIVDTSISTILTAAVLYQYGTGPVKGFAVTLIAGIVASVFTALFVTKTFYLVWLRRSSATPQTLSI